MLMDRSKLPSIASSVSSPTQDGKIPANQLSLFRQQSDSMSDASTQAVNTAKSESPSNLKKDDIQSGLLEKHQEEKPKRPLSAYNIFFKDERERLLETMKASSHSNPSEKLGFAAMARTVAVRWREVDPTQKAYYDHLASLDQRRYKIEMDKWKAKKASIEAGESQPLLQQQQAHNRGSETFGANEQDPFESMTNSVLLPLSTHSSSKTALSWEVSEYHERCQRFGLYERLATILGPEETSIFVQMFRN